MRRLLVPVFRTFQFTILLLALGTAGASDLAQITYLTLVNRMLIYLAIGLLLEVGVSYCE